MGKMIISRLNISLFLFVVIIIFPVTIIPSQGLAVDSQLSKLITDYEISYTVESGDFAEYNVTQAYQSSGRSHLAYYEVGSLLKILVLSRTISEYSPGEEEERIRYYVNGEKNGGDRYSQDFVNPIEAFENTSDVNKFIETLQTLPDKYVGASTNRTLEINKSYIFGSDGSYNYIEIHRVYDWRSGWLIFYEENEWSRKGGELIHHRTLEIIDCSCFNTDDNEKATFLTDFNIFLFGSFLIIIGIIVKFRKSWHKRLGFFKL